VVAVTPLWDSGDGLPTPGCDIVESDSFPRRVGRSKEMAEVVTFNCPPRIPIPHGVYSIGAKREKDSLASGHEFSFHPLNFGRTDTRPNLDVFVNFTDLMSPGEIPGGKADLILDAVQVYVALTSRTDLVLSTTRPISLTPGASVVGIVDLLIRRRFNALSVSTLFDGILEVRLSIFNKQIRFS